MQRPRHVVAVALVFALVAFAAALPVGRAQQAPRATVLRFAGVGHNVTVDRSTGVTFVVRTSDGTHFVCSGGYDGANLYGRFNNLPGQRVPCEGSNLCLVFAGSLEFGGDGSGFPTGTQASYRMSVTVNGSNATGTYHIGRVPGLPFEQDGVLTLFVQNAAPR